MLPSIRYIYYNEALLMDKHQLYEFKQWQVLSYLKKYPGWQYNFLSSYNFWRDIWRIHTTLRNFLDYRRYYRYSLRYNRNRPICVGDFLSKRQLVAFGFNFIGKKQKVKAVDIIYTFKCTGNKNP